MPQKQQSSWSRYRPAFITLLVGTGLSLGAFLIVWRWENNRRQYEFNRYADSVATALEQNFKNNLQLLPYIRNFFLASDKVEPEEFTNFVKQTPQDEHPSLNFLAWAPKISNLERISYENQNNLQTPFEIREVNPQGELVRAPERNQYFPLYYITQHSKNQQNQGLDIASQPAYQRLIQQATDTGTLTVSSNINLNKVKNTDIGLIAIQPVYNSNVTPTTRRDNLKGLVIAVFSISHIFESALAGKGVGNLDLYLAEKPDTTNPTSSPPQFLAFYDSSTEQVVEFPTAQKLLQTNKKPNQAIGTKTIEFGGRKWTLYLLSTPRYEQIQTKPWRSWAILIAGLLWTNIPVTYLLTSLSRQQQIEKLASERAHQAEQLQQALQQLSKEQEKSEKLLLNILPGPIAERLKQQPDIIADSFPAVTVLFADIVGFSQLATRISAPELVEVLNQIFSAFDRLTQTYHLEKIKTIGDAYMVVGGLPTPRPDHASAIAEFALAMQQEIVKFNSQNTENFHIRIGIHTGPVVAGVIGTNKFIYDLWGDTVNIASRMESHGLPDTIQVTQTTYLLLKDKFDFEMRGQIPIKGKGEMTTYLLTGKRRLSQYPLQHPINHPLKHFHPNNDPNPLQVQSATLPSPT
ncbi:CHASE domain-containing protein [Ancylothrix sp. C2]|uniref:adenylate/guanylate cyclase domain-containing protein n=1 Tax=Ancylothrix sp. D3o TaxID=2953691 RepID=UPI0021BAA5A6|nr:adenylate/guanylate cyclase domain-containing protein [Ancylothrix sp. D3o]MCT7952864.1 CHASE domain-containing protein [Ancylothrix sp. D3o]